MTTIRPWQDDQQTIASSLNAAGYQTFVTGKWGIGSIGANLPHRFGFDRSWVLGPMTIEGWDVSYENLGKPGSMAAIGHEWASVSAAPFRLFKFNTTEGGLRVPMVISGPGIENLGIVDSRSQVADITPTLLDLAGVTIDPGAFHGRSWKPLLEGRTRQVYGDSDTMVFEVSGEIDGPYKAGSRC